MLSGKVVKLQGDKVVVKNAEIKEEYLLTGKTKFNQEIPQVGDYVELDIDNKVIKQILPRKNSLYRPVVSNVDQVLIVISLTKPTISYLLLDKLIFLARLNKITPLICLTKLDLVTRSELKNILKELSYYQKLGYKIYNNKQLFRLKRIFKHKTTVLAGLSGVGKSSLLNKLDVTLKLKTGEISNYLERGKHTTRQTELLDLYGGEVLDTPGFSFLEITNYQEEDIAKGFKEIDINAHKCQFRSCKHIKETGCYIKELVNNKKIKQSRYDNYLYLMKENNNG